MTNPGKADSFDIELDSKGLDSSVQEIVLGAVVAPQGYELSEEIGRGGMGVVHRARQVSLDRTVAIKFLREGILNDAAVDRFFAEARSLAKLRHPNVVQVYDAGCVDGRPYLVMDHIQGVTVTELIRDWSDDLPVRDAVRIVREVAAGVDHVNRQGIVHCDINPRNIMVDHTRRSCVMDFGIARAVGTVTRDTVQEYGTPAYLAPERLRAGAEIDARTDVYSLGAVLYFMVTRNHPFSGRTARSILRKVLTQDPQPPREINSRLATDLETIILKSMDKEPAARYATVGELAEDLDRYLSGEAISARPLGPVTRTLRFIGRHKLAAALVSLTLAAAASVQVYIMDIKAQVRDRERQYEELEAFQKKLARTYAANLQREKDKAEVAEEKIRLRDAELASLQRELEARQREYAAAVEDTRRAREAATATAEERRRLQASLDGATRLAVERLQAMEQTSEEARQAAADLNRVREEVSRQEEEIQAREEQIAQMDRKLERLLEEKEQAVNKVESALAREMQRQTEEFVRMLRRDPNPRTRLLAAQKLGERTDLRTLPYLVQAALDDEDTDVRRAAISALGRFEAEEATDALARLAHGARLVEVREAATTELCRQVDDRRARVLAACLRDSDEGVVVTALQGLISARRIDALQEILGCLAATRPEAVRSATVQGLAQLMAGDARVARYLYPLLSDPDPRLRRTTAYAMRQFPDRKTVRELAKLRKDDDEMVRREAVNSLGSFAPDDDALLSVVDFLADPAAGVATAAAGVLRAATGQSFGFHAGMSRSEVARVQTAWRRHLQGR